MNVFSTCGRSKALLFVIFLFATSIFFEANAITYFSAVSGNWNAAGSWTLVSGTGGGAGVPVAGDVVIIERGHTITITANAACTSIQLGSTLVNNAGSITFSGAFTLAVSGAITLGGSGNNNRDGNLTFATGSIVNAGSISFGGTGGTPGQGAITMTNGGTLSIAGAITVNAGGGTWTRGTGLVEFTANNTLPTTIFNNFNNLSINGGTTTLSAAITVAGSFNVVAGSFNANAFTNGVTGLATISGTGSYSASTALQTFSGGLTVSGGTFNGSTGGVTTTNLSLTSGTLNAPTGTFNVSGNWSNSGGTFSAGTGTVTFNGGTAQAINGTATTQTFNNIIINKGGASTLTVGGSTATLNTAAITQTLGNFTAPTTLNATGALTLTAGTFTAGANTNLEGDFLSNGGTFTSGTNTVTFGGSGAKTIAGTNGTTATFYDLIVTSGSVLFGNNNTARTLNISNNLTISGGSFLSGVTVAGVHTINLTGNLQNDGTIDLTSNSATAHRLILLGTAKAVTGSGATTLFNLRLSTTAAANVTLSKNVRINGALDWTADGLLVLNNSDFTFGAAGAVTTPGANRYIQTDGTSSLTGQVVKVNGGSTASWQFLFPIGTATNGYTPVDLTTATITNNPTSNSRLATKLILGPDETGRLKRTYRMSVTGNGISTTFTNGRFNYYNPNDVSGLEPIASYTTFWYQKESTGIWTRPGGTAPGTVNTSPTLSFFTGPSVAQPLTNDTYYFTIGTPGAYGQTWYSYQTGNWDNPLTWTTDGSSFPLYVNPTNSIPGFADNVVIKSGNAVTVNVNNITINSINVIGTLDLLASINQTFTTISGSGRIKMAGTSDNFPAGTATNFADNAIGGTLEINGGGILLNSVRTFNHVVVNMSTSTNSAILKNNITLNGDLIITRGILQFEDITAPANRTLTVNGNVTIAANGGIRTANSNNRHEFNFYGDFTNGGVSYFTNRTTADYGNEATNGIVDVNFVSPSRDQHISCNGETRFYRIEISKGTDDTYKTSVSASATSNFNLFGYADQDHGSIAQLATNNNAIGLLYGTLELGGNVIVPNLSTAANYNISEGAQLWINGGTLNKNIGNSLVPYGKLRVTNGILTANVVAGITTRDNGAIIVEGGTVTTNQIRTSVNGPTNVGSYIQSGGTVTVDGDGPGGTGLDYYVFSLTYTGNVFNMSGGDLIVKGARAGTGGTRGAVYINSDPSNISVTGGRVIFEISNNNTYRVTSKAPFWNVLMRRSAGTATVVELNSGDSGVGGGLTSISTVQPLAVLNDFAIESPVNFTTNNANLVVGGNIDINNGATYTHGTNTTTINGGGVSSLIFGSTTTTQSFNNLTINKTTASDEVVIDAGRPSPNAAIQVNGTFTFSNGVFDYKTFIASARSTVTSANGATVGKAVSTGKLALDGTVDQTLNSSGGTFYNLELNNSDASPVVTLGLGNLTVLGTLTMTSGIFDINTRKLTMSGASASIAGAGFGASKMIQSSANASDGGLELYLDANESLTYPIGVAGKYTPATASFTSFADDGLVAIIPANGALQTTNLSGGDVLSYYWRVSHSNFTTLPTVSYTFTYVSGDVVGAENLYVPGKVLDVSPFTRSFENDVTKVNDATNVISFNGSGSGFTLENANYTAGASGRFTGTVRVFYTRILTDAYNTAWTDDNIWTLVTNAGINPHRSDQGATTQSPGAGDIAVIGYVPFDDPIVANRGMPHGIELSTTQPVAEVRFTQMLSAGGVPTSRVYFRNFQFRPTLCLNNSGTQGQLGSGTKVSGEGMFWNRSVGGNLSDPAYVGVDLGAFNAQDSAYVVYENTLATGTYNNVPSAFPNLMMATDGWGDADKNSIITKDITVNGDLEILGDVNLLLNTASATGNISVNKRLRFFRSNANGNDSGGGGELRFGNTGPAKTVTVFGNLVLGNGYAALIRVLTPGTTPINHTLNLHGNFIQQTTAGNGFKAGTVATQDRINVNLLGSSSMVLTNNGGDTPQFYSLTVNKGSSISTSASFNSLFTIDGPTDQAIKSLTLQNGLFIINAAANVTLTSGGGDFNIPNSAGLQVNLGTVRTSTTNVNANITLDGLLRVSGGTVIVDGGGATDSNYIQYSNSGNAAIEVTGGSLTVSGQIRRDLTSATGVLKYTQSAGTVLVGNESFDTALRGVFEIINPGSQFNHSGGSFTVVRGNGSTSIPSFWLEPGSASVTSGSTITIGNASTPTGTIGIQSTTALNNLTIAGAAANTPQVSMYVTPLTVNGNLIVSTGNTLNALSRDLTIGGNFTVNGTYTSGNNTTAFTNTGAATIGGAVSALSFYNFTKTGGGTLALARDITINRDLKVSSGVLSTASFAINLLRHAEVDATITSSSGNGLVFGSTLGQQQLTRSASGTGTIGIVTINNANGVIIPDGNGYDFSIANGLRLQSGVFDIGSALLSLQTPALITPVSPFSATNLIQTNSSFTDKGVRKQFPANYTTDFVFPVGQSNYTPVTFNFSSGNTTGSTGAIITVRPSNRIHPVIINDDGPGELPSPAAFNDLNNVLQYYWIVGASNVASDFKSVMSLQYVQPLVSVVNPYSEADYIAARILTDPSINPSLNISKFSQAEVNEGTNVVSFNFTSVVDQRSISGDYFAGVSVAIPDDVATYTTVTSGNVGDNIYDSPVFGGIPTGARVIVSAGDEVTFNTGSVILYQSVINAGGKIVIPSGSIGHSLGTLSGTGDLEINSDDVSAVLPAAVYDTFFSCAGGGLIFGGSGTYEIMGGITTVRDLTLNGTGDKSLANNNLTICNNLTINGGGFFNSSNRTVTVLNDVLINSGMLDNSAGTLTITRDLTQSAGGFEGGTGGVKTVGRNLTVNGGTFNPGSGSTNTIRVNGNMTLAGAATIVTGTNGQRFVFGGSSNQSLNGNFTATRAFNRFEINNSAGLTLIAGDATVVTELILTNGLISPGLNTFLLGSASSSTPNAGSSNSFVNGKLYRIIGNAFGGATFPIGKGNRWRSAAVLSASEGGVTWGLEYFDFTPSGVVADAPSPRNNPINTFASSDPLVLRIASGEYWRVSDGSATSNGRTAIIGLSWGIESNVSTNLAQREALKVMSWNGTDWTNNGGTNFAPGGAHTQSRGTFQSTGTLSFSENIVTLGSTEAANPLPILLSLFKGEIVGDEAYLYWKTESELNNDYFEIQRSFNGGEFVTVGKVTGRGTTKEASEYAYEDPSLQLGKNYYRLKQVDFDGRTSYSETILLNHTGLSRLGLKVFPNPTRSLNINFKVISSQKEGDMVIRLFDLTGRIVYKAELSVDDIGKEILINAGELKTGVYVLEAIQGKGRATQRVMIKD